MKIKKFEIRIDRYFGESYSLVYLKKLFLYRAQTDGITTSSGIDPIFINDYQYKHIAIFQSDSDDVDLVISKEENLIFTTVFLVTANLGKRNILTLPFVMVRLGNAIFGLIILD